MLYSNLSIRNHHLYMQDIDVTEAAKEYGTPLYLMDENRIRENARKYLEYTRKYLGENAIVCYASKACDFRYMYEIMHEEGLDADVVSPGEFHIALKGHMEPSKLHYHGNNKSDYDIEYGIKNHAGYFIADSLDELTAINNIAARYNIRQKVLLRLTPGIDPHTHKKVSTGNTTSKFGISLSDAPSVIKEALSLPDIILDGFHYHIGSQIFEITPFLDALDIIFDFMHKINDTLGYLPSYLDIGGGFPVRYTADDPQISLEDYFKAIGNKLDELKNIHNINPRIMIEPGRSIVADAGMTLYTVGSYKTNGLKNYISIDGGMSDNPRYTLYESRYTFVKANDADNDKYIKADIAGRCCESGDLLGEDVIISEVKRGDIIAVLTTGAYNYSMQSHYNQNQGLPVIMICDGKLKTVVKRDGLDDLLHNQL